VFIKAVTEYRDVGSAYYSIGMQFLGLSSILYISEYPHLNIKEAISFDDKFVAAGDIVGISVYN
jgi:hypothetical protein